MTWLRGCKELSENLQRHSEKRRTTKEWVGGCLESRWGFGGLWRSEDNPESPDQSLVRRGMEAGDRRSEAKRDRQDRCAMVSAPDSEDGAGRIWAGKRRAPYSGWKAQGNESGPDGKRPRRNRGKPCPHALRRHRHGGKLDARLAATFPTPKTSSTSFAGFGGGCRAFSPPRKYSLGTEAGWIR